MTVVFTRIITPKPGHLDDTMKFAKKRIAALKSEFGLDITLSARFGGPTGQLIMVSYHDNMGDLEAERLKVIQGVGDGKIPQPKPGIIANVKDAIWINL